MKEYAAKVINVKNPDEFAIGEPETLDAVRAFKRTIEEMPGMEDTVKIEIVCREVSGWYSFVTG